jgi:large subunit ribosomal protein L7/L12
MSEETTVAAEATTEDKAVEVPSKFKALVESIETMTVLDLADLVKVLEEKFGVSASAPAMMMAPGAGAGEAAADEQTEFDVELASSGENKISVIKAVRAITGEGLKDAKAMVDGIPTIIKAGVSKDEAQELKTQLEDAGGAVNLK